ncbi:MAG: sigma-70 family RNA polymerase sigma factor [Planctomycetota bacterium]
MEGNDPENPLPDPLIADARLLAAWPAIAYKVRNSLARILPAHDLDDVMQKTVITVLLHNRTEEIRSLEGFAQRTAGLLAKRALRDSRRQPRSIDSDSAIDSLEEPLQGADRSHQHRLREILIRWRRELPPRRAKAVGLALGGHGSVAAIAEAMGCTEANVRQHLDFAIEQLKRPMAPAATHQQPRADDATRKPQVGRPPPKRKRPRST